jgi:hypothetical protein
MLTWITGLICGLTGRKSGHKKGTFTLDFYHRVNVSADSELVDIVCTTSSEYEEGNMQVHLQVCGRLSSFDASEDLVN